MKSWRNATIRGAGKAARVGPSPARQRRAGLADGAQNFLSVVISKDVSERNGLRKLIGDMATQARGQEARRWLYKMLKISPIASLWIFVWCWSVRFCLLGSWPRRVISQVENLRPPNDLRPPRTPGLRLYSLERAARVSFIARSSLLVVV